MASGRNSHTGFENDLLDLSPASSSHYDSSPSLQYSPQHGMDREMPRNSITIPELNGRKESLELENTQLREHLDEAKAQIQTLKGQLMRMDIPDGSGYFESAGSSSEDETVKAGSRRARRFREPASEEFYLFKDTGARPRRRSVMNLLRNRCLN